MIGAIAILLSATAGQPAQSSVDLTAYCRTVSERGVEAGRPPLDCHDEPPFEGQPTLQVCLTREGAGRHSACRPVLEEEAALAPDGLFNTANATPPARLEGWLGAVCASDRLTAGQTAETCRADAASRLERARAARAALRGGWSD